MASKGASDRLQVNQDLKHEKGEWRVEQISWIVMGMFVLAALAGLLGPGPLSNGEAGERTSGFWVEYKKFERYQAPSKVVIHMTPSSREHRLWVNQEFISSVELKHIDPMPDRSEAGTDRYTFPLRFSESKNETIVTMHFEPNRFGIMGTEIGLENGPSARFTQMIYP